MSDNELHELRDRLARRNDLTQKERDAIERLAVDFWRNELPA